MVIKAVLASEGSFAYKAHKWLDTYNENTLNCDKQYKMVLNAYVNSNKFRVVTYHPPHNSLTFP